MTTSTPCLLAPAPAARRSWPRPPGGRVDVAEARLAGPAAVAVEHHGDVPGSLLGRAPVSRRACARTASSSRSRTPTDDQRTPRPYAPPVGRRTLRRCDICSVASSLTTCPERLTARHGCRKPRVTTGDRPGPRRSGCWRSRGCGAGCTSGRSSSRSRSGDVLVAVAAALRRGGRGRSPPPSTASRSSALFGVSALYHRHTWRTPRGPGDHEAPRPLDDLPVHRGHVHAGRGARAGPGHDRGWVLAVVWAGALAGRRAQDAVAARARRGWRCRSTWRSAGSRCSCCPTCCTNGGVAAFVLLLAGGALYTAGAVFYATIGRTRGRTPSATTSSSTRPRCSPRSATTSRSGWPCSRLTLDGTGQGPSPVGALGPQVVHLGHGRPQLGRATRRRAARPAGPPRPARRSATGPRPASTSVSSTTRSGCRSRVITGTEATVNSSLGVADPRTPRDLAP